MTTCLRSWILKLCNNDYQDFGKVTAKLCKMNRIYFVQSSTDECKYKCVSYKSSCHKVHQIVIDILVKQMYVTTHVRANTISYWLEICDAVVYQQVGTIYKLLSFYCNSVIQYISKTLHTLIACLINVYLQYRLHGSIYQ